jgi:carboxylesterase
MDSKKTAPFEFGDGPDACLLIHGFTGSPWDMRPLGERLGARGYHVRGICLPGHGSTPEALERVTYRDWEAATADELRRLQGFRRVYVAGLSMGALLAVLISAARRAPPHALALIAPAMRFRGVHLRALRALRDFPILDLLRPYISKTGTDIEDPVSRADAPILAGFPSARLHDVWTLQDRARAALPAIRVPVLIAVARQDHVVSIKGARELARGLSHAPRVEWLELRQGFHIIPRDRGLSTLADTLVAFFEGSPLPDAATV